MPEHLQGRTALKPHHLWMHQQEAIQAQILRRLHGRALLHPLQIQNHRRGVRVSERDWIHLEDAVGPGLLLQPQLQKPQRHLLRAGELLWLPRSHELTDVTHVPLTSFFFYATFCICICIDYVQGIFLSSFFPIGKICEYKMNMCLQNGFIKHDVPLRNILGAALQIFNQRVCEILRA